MPAISVKALGKKYRVDRARSTSFGETLSRVVTAPWTVWRRPESEEFWALKDVELSVNEGEVVGIIGRNGAGKSTLLKILSRVTRPTCGEAIVRGRLGALLEVGTGFHPELSGRENIYLSGSILGMSRREIASRFDEIVEFADVARFLDMPVKRYSSGMHVRLGFAVAAHLHPDVMLVDEVLAVGDAGFQKKCFGSMQDAARSGRTVLLVSHNMVAVETLCGRAIWLEGGRIRRDGNSHEVVRDYLQFAESGDASPTREWLSQDGSLAVTAVRVRPVEPAQRLDIAHPAVLEVAFENQQRRGWLRLMAQFFDERGQCAFTTYPKPREFEPGRYLACCAIPAHLLNATRYGVDLAFTIDADQQVLGIGRAAVFTVADVPRPERWYGPVQGAVRPSLDWNVERTDR